MRFYATVGVLACVAFPPGVRADIGPRWWGDIAAEPLGLKGVDITHQALTIDLRPLARVALPGGFFLARRGVRTGCW